MELTIVSANGVLHYETDPPNLPEWEIAGLLEGTRMMIETSFTLELMRLSKLKGAQDAAGEGER
jgi:hypothetical protein